MMVMQLRRFLGLFMVSISSVLLSNSLEAFNGSFSFNFDQRYFNSNRLGEANSFSSFQPSFEVIMGVYEFENRIEPVIGLSFIKDSTRICAVQTAGGYACDPSIGLSEDKFDLLFLTLSTGARWKVWDRSFFWVTPFVQAQVTYRYGRIERKTSNVLQERVVTGGEFGGDLMGGVEISFLYDRATEIELQQEWGIKDFGLNLHGRYLPSGLFQHGLGLVSDTGGWSFGGGLFIDW